MNARLLLLPLALSVTLPAVAFDLGNFTKAISGSDDKIGKGIDTAKDLGKVAKGVAGIGPEEEKVIGDSVALEIIGKYGGLVKDKAVMLRINLIGRTLASYSDRPDLTWRFAVLDSSTVNAFSAPAGYVFITRGLYELASDDDALAGILGHEIAHVTGKHALNIVAKGDALAGATSQLVKRSGNLRVVDSQLQQFDLGVGKITKTLFETGYAPQTEYTADRTGHDLAELSGYAPGGLRGVLARLQRRGDPQQKAFSTHPPLPERIRRLPDEPAQLSNQKNSEPTGATAGSRSLDEDDKKFADAAKKSGE